MKKQEIIFLDVMDTSFGFSATIENALEQAQSELTILNETIDSIKKLQPNCDRVDYILAASSGALCGVIDIFLVGKPSESPLGNITDKWFASRTMDFARLCHPEHKKFDNLDSAIRFLERKFKVPYDQTHIGNVGKEVFNLTPTNHHFKSLGHNPSLLGLFFSIFDQFTNNSHFITDGQLISLEKADAKWELKGKNIPSKLFCGFVNWLGHLISDASGSSSSAHNNERGMGIPSPLWTWSNDIIAIKSKLGLKATDTDKAINELSLRIFEKGYDSRFQTTQAIPIFLNEMLVRVIYAIRRFFNYLQTIPSEKRSFSLMWKKCEPFSNATVKRMLTVAHGTFCLVDLGDATVRSFMAGAGTFDVVEFVLRLNIVGIGRFAISLYGEGKRAFSYVYAKLESGFVSKQMIIVKDYIEGLRELSRLYNDDYLLNFVNEFEKSDAYKKAFEKSIQLAKLRKVPDDKILKTKKDIDYYFNGGK